MACLKRRILLIVDCLRAGEVMRTLPGVINLWPDNLAAVIIIENRIIRLWNVLPDNCLPYV